MTLDELRSQLSGLQAERNAIVEASEQRFATPDDTTEVRGAFLLGEDGEPIIDADGQRSLDPHVGLTNDEATRWTEIDDEMRSLQTRIARAETVESAPATSTMRGDAPNIAPMSRTENPHELRSNQTPTEARGQALTVIEQLNDVPDSVRSALTTMVEERRSSRDTAVLARHVIASSSPAYRSATLAYFADRPLNEEQRAALSAVDEQRATLMLSSGWTLPATVDPTIVRTGELLSNPMRMYATTQTVVTDKAAINTMGGVTASWDLENEEVSDDSPTPASIEIDVVKPEAFVEYTIESEQDIGGLEAELMGLLAEAKNNLEAGGFLSGTGVEPQPEGLLTGVAASGIPPVVGAVDEANLYALRAALPQRYRSSASFVANQITYDTVRQIESTGGGRRLWTTTDVSLQEGSPDRLLGRPALEMSGVPDATVVYGDLRNGFRIVDRVGMTVERVPLLMGANNRPRGARGLYCYWRVGSGVVNGDAVRILAAA